MQNYFWRMWVSFSTSQRSRVVPLASWLNHLASGDMIEGQSEICCLPTMKRSSLPFFQLLICQVRICIVWGMKTTQMIPWLIPSLVIQPIYFVAEEITHWSLSSFWGPSPQTYHIFPWQDSGMSLVCSLLNSKSKSASFIPNYGLLNCSLTRSYAILGM